jgi:hypothetical protein
MVHEVTHRLKEGNSTKWLISSSLAVCPGFGVARALLGIAGPSPQKKDATACWRLSLDMLERLGVAVAPARVRVRRARGAREGGSAFF